MRLFWRIATLYFKIKDYLKPPPPIQYTYCYHCRQEYPKERIKILTFSEAKTITLNFRQEEIPNDKSMTYYLTVCDHCVDAKPELKTVIIEAGSYRFFWNSYMGESYECQEIPKEKKIPKRTNRNN